MKHVQRNEEIIQDREKRQEERRIYEFLNYFNFVFVNSGQCTTAQQTAPCLIQIINL